MPQRRHETNACSRAARMPVACLTHRQRSEVLRPFALLVSGSDGICAGFASQEGGAQECLLYGPGMSGSCAAPNEAIVWKDACEAIGSCDAPGAAASRAREAEAFGESVSRRLS